MDWGNSLQPGFRRSGPESQVGGGLDYNDKVVNTFETESREGTPDSSKSDLAAFKLVEGPFANDPIPTLDATIPIVRENELDPLTSFQAGKYHLIPMVLEITSRLANFGQLRRLWDFVKVRVVRL